MTCTVSGEELGVKIVSFIQKCEYPDGTRILVRTTLELGGGRILRQVDVVERPP
jgi:hypothetical protein